MNQQAFQLTETQTKETPRSLVEIADELKAELVKRLYAMAVCYERAKAAAIELNAHLTVNAEIPSGADAIRGVFYPWLDETIRSYEAAGQGVAHATISKNDLSSRCGDLEYFGRLSYQIGEGGNEPSLVDAISSIIDKYDFYRLVEELSRHSAALEERGLSEAADRLVCDLGLNADYHREHPPKKVGRFWVFSRRLYHDGYSGYGYSANQDLHKLRLAFAAAEEDAGLSGLDYAMSQIVEAIGSARERFASRTKLAEGEAVEAVLFKEKVEFRVSHETGDGLLAFMACHTTKTLVDL